MISILVQSYLDFGVCWAVYWQLEIAHAYNPRTTVIRRFALNLFLWPVMVFLG